MIARQLISQIDALQTKRQICVLGAAIIDLVMKAPRLPLSGEDILLSQQERHIGGCAFNIALMLKRLGLNSYNALPIGNGVWANEVSQMMGYHDISSVLYNPEGDNGWCLALVEPSGERTFLTIEGVENTWNWQILNQLQIEKDALIYLSGYQLTSNTGETILDWLESLTTPFTLFIDFGPRISKLSEEILNRLFAFKPILSVNRQEAQFLGLNTQSEDLKLSVQNFAKKWFDIYQTPIIVRLDCLGAYCYEKEKQTWTDIFPVKVIDTIGAGDNHAGGVLAALSANWSLSDAVLLGNAVASYVVGQSGADCSPTKEQLIKHIRH